MVHRQNDVKSENSITIEFLIELAHFSLQLLTLAS